MLRGGRDQGDEIESKSISSDGAGSADEQEVQKKGRKTLKYLPCAFFFISLNVPKFPLHYLKCCWLTI